jgi:hypothetical protein
MASRPLRWLDKVMLGAVMAVAAFVLERIVIRATKKATGDDPRDAPRDHVVETPHTRVKI